MFNRRHHCRRCGRVVCGTCSSQRIHLATYPDSVAVRVCNDCMSRMAVESLNNAASSSKSNNEITANDKTSYDSWRLTVDEIHNKTLRDEFSFENAPSVTLCLAILNLHSDNEAYSKYVYLNFYFLITYGVCKERKYCNRKREKKKILSFPSVCLSVCLDVRTYVDFSCGHNNFRRS